LGGYGHQNLPQPQTIIHKQAPPDYAPPAPPQPLLKYHLIRHSYPATEEEAEFQIPAFLPGPPYLNQQPLPNIKKPPIKHANTHVKKNRQDIQVSENKFCIGGQTSL
jgi:hypothetical protein